MANMHLSGSCACGKVTYTCTSAPSHLDFCYCITCQQQSGAPFMAWTGVPRDSISWTTGRDLIHTWRAPFGNDTTATDTNTIAERGFCSACGSTLTLQYDLYPHKTHLAASTVRPEDAGQLPGVGVHIWCRRCPEWYGIPEDGVRRYEEFDEEFQQLLDGYLGETKGA